MSRTNFNIHGQFRVRYSSGEEVVFNNTHTAAGIQRILELMAGVSTENWDAIRLIGAGAEQLQKETSPRIETGKLINDALFTAAERPWAAVTAEMYAGATLVATASVNIPGGQTVFVSREDILTAV